VCVRVCVCAWGFWLTVVEALLHMYVSEVHTPKVRHGSHLGHGGGDDEVLVICGKHTHNT
jgi:hypothetical protein